MTSSCNRSCCCCCCSSFHPKAIQTIIFQTIMSAYRKSGWDRMVRGVSVCPGRVETRAISVNWGLGVSHVIQQKFVIRSCVESNFERNELRNIRVTSEWLLIASIGIDCISWVDLIAGQGHLLILCVPRLDKNQPINNQAEALFAVPVHVRACVRAYLCETRFSMRAPQTNTCSLIALKQIGFLPSRPLTLPATHLPMIIESWGRLCAGPNVPPS